MKNKIENTEVDLTPGNYKILNDNLGKGGFGVVKLIEVPCLQKFALKENLKSDQESIISLKREYEITKFGLKNVVKSFSCFEDVLNHKFYYCMELMDCNLNKFIRNHIKNKIEEFKSSEEDERVNMSFNELFPVLRDIITGLKSLNRANVVHRDLKPSNILISNSGVAKVGDIGTAKTFDPDASSEKITIVKNNENSEINKPPVVGSMNWMAPEIKNQDISLKKELPKTDIFSLGLIIFFCLDTNKFNKFQEQIKFNDDETHLKNYLESFQERKNLPKLLFKSLESMVSFNPNNRPSIDIIYKDFVEDGHFYCKQSNKELNDKDSKSLYSKKEISQEGERLMEDDITLKVSMNIQKDDENKRRKFCLERKKIRSVATGILMTAIIGILIFLAIYLQKKIKDNEELANEINRLYYENSYLNNNLTKLNNTIIDLDKRLIEKNEMINNLTTTVAKSNYKIELLNNELEDMQNSSLKLKSTINTMKFSLNESNETINYLKKSLNNSNFVIESLSSNLAASNHAVQRLKNSVEILTAILKKNNIAICFQDFKIEGEMEEVQTQLIKSMAECGNIVNLTLNFLPRTSNGQDEPRFWLGKTKFNVSTLATLSSLKIITGGESVTNMLLAKGGFVEFITRNKNLINLELDFRTSPKNDGHYGFGRDNLYGGFETSCWGLWDNVPLINDMLAVLTNLRSLTILTRFCNIEKSSIMQWIDTLANNPNLNHLNLDFAKNGMLDLQKSFNMSEVENYFNKVSSLRGWNGTIFVGGEH